MGDPRTYPRLDENRLNVQGVLAFFELARNLLNLFFEWSQRRALRKAFENENMLATLQRALALIALAKAARLASLRASSDAGGLREDDGYRRSS
ncbi:MAG: hypothetical protein V4691_04995 [Pseudomonadota bacterium]